MNTFLPRALVSAVVLSGALAGLTAVPSAAATPAEAPSAPLAGQAYPAGDGPMGAGWYGEVNFPNDHDGTMLHADILLPGAPEDAPAGGWPMIVSGGPYFSCSKSVTSVSPLCEGPVERFADFIEGADIFANGYGWAQVDTRGYGSSANCNDYGGIGEQTDMASAVDFFGSQDYANGKVGLWGKSYDAWTQVMALAQHPEHLAAAVIQAPLIEGYRLAWDNGVHWDAGWYATTGLYALYDNEPIGADGDAQEHAQSAESTARAGECWPENAAFASAGYDRELPYWTERNLIPEATTSMVPTFWTMGFQDVNTKPTNLIDVFSELPGYHKGWFGHWDHVRGNEVHREDFFTEVMDFLEVTLKDQPGYELPINAQMLTRIQTNFGDWYEADTFPPSDVEMFELTLNEGSYTDRPDADDEDADGIWTCTPTMPYTVHFSGEPLFHVQTAPDLPMSNLLTRIFAVDEKGRAELISRGAVLLEEDANTGQGSTVSFLGWPSDFVLEEGDRLAVVFTSTSAEHQPVHTGGQVAVTAASVELPFRTQDTVYDDYTDMAFPPYASDLSDVDFSSCADWEFPPENQSRFLDDAPAPAPAPAAAPAPVTEPASAPLPATGGGLALAGLALLGAGRSLRRREA